MNSGQGWWNTQIFTYGSLEVGNICAVKRFPEKRSRFKIRGIFHQVVNCKLKLHFSAEEGAKLKYLRGFVIRLNS